MIRSLLFLLLLITIYSFSQTSDQTKINSRGCGTGIPGEEWDVWFNNKVEEYKLDLASGKPKQANYTIPVIFHIIHGGQSVGTFPNISQAQIKSQISVMNADYAGTGYNVNQLASTAFSAVGAANCNITFCLAQLDPNGNPLTEPGIERINYLSKSWTNPNSPNTTNSFISLMNGTIKPQSIWDPRYYFNIWITDVNSGASLLGYATFPPGSGLTGLPGSLGTLSTDGIWVWAKATGSVGTLDPVYNKGRTASHEAGHWLGLRHIGGDGNNNPAGDCNATDYCNDTPPQKGGYNGGQYGQNFGSPSYPLHVGVCTGAPNGDMFMNFMDYVDDPKCYMFTPDQRTRMQTAMANSALRQNLTASSATLCSLSPVPPVATFSISVDTLCRDSAIVLKNNSSGIPGPTFNWSSNSVNMTFAPSSSVQNPTISSSIPGTYSIVLTASNSAGTNSTTKILVIEDCGNLDAINKYSKATSLFSIRPNPNNGNFNLFLNNNLQNTKVEVFNSLGEIVYFNNYENISSGIIDLNLTDLPSGVYNVQVIQSGLIQNKRLVITR